MIAHLQKYAALSICFLLFTPLCVGAQCLGPSPTLRQGKNPYAPVSVRKLTPAEQQMTGDLFKSLAGDWHGQAESFFCTSADDPAEIERDRETIKADIGVDYYGNLSLNAAFYSRREKTSRQQVLTLYRNQGMLRIDHDTGAGDVQLIEVSDTRLAFLYRRVVPVGGSGSSRREYFFTLTTDGDSFTIEQRLYIQGKLSSGHTWRCKRG